MNNPKDFRYDKRTPMQPVVNMQTTKPTLTEEQQEKRKKLLKQMQETVEKDTGQNNEEEQLAKAALPFDYEAKHPGEDYPDENENSEMSRYRITLSQALETPEMKSIRFGVIGTGQCGGRLAEQFSRFGYPVCTINTAEQDLAYLDIPDNNKLLMKYALGGAGKSLAIGQKAAAENQEQIQELLNRVLTDVDQVLICVGGGGGSGGGSIVPLLQSIMSAEAISGLPIIVIYTLPMTDEGATPKSNAVKTLERIAAMVDDEVISSLIIVDNAKIEKHYPQVSIKDFWRLANFDIVNHFNMFNTVSKCATNYDALDPMDFANIVSTGGCLIYGKVELPVSISEDGQINLDEGSLARALIRGSQEGTLAEGFDVTQAVSLGAIITGSDQVLSQIPAMNINYAFNELAQTVGEDCTIFRGMYADDTATDTITVYTIYAGLGLPFERITDLREEASRALEKNENKKKAKISLTGGIKGDPYAEVRDRNSSMGKMIERRRRR